MLNDGVDEFLGGDVGAEVNDLEPGAFQHHGNQVLADTCTCAARSASAGVSCRSPLTVPTTTLPAGVAPPAARCGFKMARPPLHGAGGDEHFGDGDHVPLEQAADLTHRGDQAVLHRPLRDQSGRQGCVHACLGAFSVPFPDCVAEGLDLLHGVFP